MAQSCSDNGPALTRQIMDADEEKEDSIAREVRLDEAIAKIAQDNEELLKRLSR